MWASAHDAYPKQNTGGPAGKSLPSHEKSTRGTAKDRKGDTTSDRPDPRNSHLRNRCRPPKNEHSRTPRSLKQSTRLGFAWVTGFHLNFQLLGPSTVLRPLPSSNTDCNCVIVSEEAVSDIDVSSSPRVLVEDYLGRGDEFPAAQCFIRCPYFDNGSMVFELP